MITSKRPSDEFGGEARVSYGSFDALSASCAINLPLIEDRLAFRLTVGHNSGGDWANNTVDNREFGGGRSTAVRGSLRYTPTDAITIDLIGDHSDGRSRPATVPLVSATPIFAGPPLGAVYFGSPFARRADVDDVLDSREVQIVGNQFTETKASDFTGLVEWDLGAVTLSSVSGYRKFRVHGEQDSSPSTTPAALLGSNNTDQRQESYSQELRLSSPDEGRFKWTVGGYYFHQNTDAFIGVTNVRADRPWRPASAPAARSSPACRAGRSLTFPPSKKLTPTPRSLMRHSTSRTPCRSLAAFGTAATRKKRKSQTS